MYFDSPLATVFTQDAEIADGRGDGWKEMQTKKGEGGKNDGESFCAEGHALRGRTLFFKAKVSGQEARERE